MCHNAPVDVREQLARTILSHHMGGLGAETRISELEAGAIFPALGMVIIH